MGLSLFRGGHKPLPGAFTLRSKIIFNSKAHALVVHCCQMAEFWPNNSKEAPKNCPWPEKIGGRKIAEFRQKWQKRGRKMFLQLFRRETL
jgi:hypothetical protein